MRNKMPLVILGVVFLALIIYFSMVQQRFYNWSETYEVKGNNPYDMRVMFDLLQQRFELSDMQDRIDKVLPTDAESAAGTSYLYIGKRPIYTEEEAWHLRDYVKAGGEAFIFTNDIQDSLSEILFYPEDCGAASNWRGINRRLNIEQVLAYFNHPSINEHYYQFEYTDNHIPDAYSWSYVPEDAFCNSGKREFPIARLGGFVAANNKQSRVNFFRLKVGEGYFFFHCNPIMFSNKFMVDSVGFEYASFVFSHTNNKQLFWDRESLNYPKEFEQKRRRRPQMAAQSPLEYIFSQPALRWSWFLFIALSLTYVLLGAKRRQRPIPVLEANRNTSLEFIETIGRLYFQQQDHKGIIKKQMHLFLAHIRQRYHLVTRDLDDKLIKRIATRSKVEEAIINDIFSNYEQLKHKLSKSYTKCSPEELNNFYLLIERFHTAVRKNKFNKNELLP